MTQQARSTGESAAEQAIFVRSGEYWTIGFGPTTFSLKDVLGLRYIQRLLQHPGEEFHALDLLSEGGSGVAENAGADRASILSDATLSVGGPGDAGEMLDAKAKQNYKRRLDELREEREELQERGDREGAAAVDSEIDSLAHELARAVGFRGRDRRYGSAAERARLNVTRAIKSALQKVSERDPTLGETLDRSIRTGSFCSYIPNPRAPLSWRFSLESLKAAREDNATVTLLVRRQTRVLGAFTEGTAFVGREVERAALRRFLEQARRAQGKVVLIGGEPGVGKTRIAAEIGTEAALAGFLTFVGGCYDREDSVPFIPFIEILEAALEEARSPETFREALGSDAPELARLLPQLRRLFPDIPPPQDLPPEQSRRVLFSAVAQLMDRTARRRPMLLLLDDLHWADEGTLLLLNYLSPLIANIPVLIVGTYRDFELQPARPLAKTFDELIRLHLVERITLGGLPESAVAEMLTVLSGREPPQAVTRFFYSETEGNPFFVEELFRHLTEQGKLTDSTSGFRRDLKLGDIDVPESLRLVIGRRLARLSNATQKTLGVAAVIGRSFTFRVLEASTRADADSLLDCVEEAERAGLISSAVQYPDARFGFPHELIRQTVVSGLSAPRRQRLHHNVANAIERIYANALEEHADDLAYHLWQAGDAADVKRTVGYLEIAAKHAISRSASAEAIAHLTKELDLLKNLPHDVERDRKELYAQNALGVALQTINGYGAPEVDQAFRCALALANQIGDTPQLVSVILGQALFYGVRADHLMALKLGQQMLRIAEQNPEYILEANLVMGLCSLYVGDLSSSRVYLQEGLAVSAPQAQPLRAIQYAGHSRAMCLSYLARTLWLLGYPEQALRRSQEGLSIAQEISLPMTLAQAQGMHALLYQARRETALALEWSDKTMAYAGEHGFSYWLTLCSIVKGWLLDEVGQSDLGLTQIRRGLDGYRATGAKLGLSCFLGLLAELLGRNGRIEEGLRVMDEALLHIESTSERYYEAEVHRLNGELVLRKGGPEAAGAAEACFHKALIVARHQSAKAWELRTATSLARLWREQRRCQQARELLSPIYGWFTEGLATPDLRDARGLLDELTVPG